MNARRLFVEKKPLFRVEAQTLLKDLNENLSLHLESLRLINVYDLFGFSDALLEKCSYGVFGEKVTDTISTSLDLEGKKYLAVEYIPGQFDQRASSAEDCVHLLDPRARVSIKSGHILLFDDSLSEEQLQSIRHYYINTVESREKDMSRLILDEDAAVRPLASLEGFTQMQGSRKAEFCRSWGLAMNADDLQCVIDYFRKEGRNPTETELRILDTYWSDHCRHTTFTTRLQSLEVEESFISTDIRAQIERLGEIRLHLGRDKKPLCLMEMATIGARYLRSIGLLDDMEQSEENNACSIFIDVDEDGKSEKWLLQFKNETHNHPTEIEPFGGAATCLGGAIRDPLSGRAYVYQAMRVTGAGDITAPVSAAIAGKLPQRTISRKAAAGYSSYGNQIGLATTLVREIYHPGYTAKRMEIGAVVGAVKACNVRRESPAPGDVILLLGGRTGRDGIGGATGSSKSHSESSLETCGSEVQKGNAPQERKIQRLFRRSDVTSLIKKSNDFGAGGVSVAIGELSDGLDIYLDRVPVKYSGLNGTELSISESQERMAVVVEAADKQRFMDLCAEENVEVTHVADVTDRGRMRIFFHGTALADLSRSFIDSAGAPHYAQATISAVQDKDPFVIETRGTALQDKMREILSSDNVASQKGLAEMFDSSIGRSTVLMPFGGRRQLSEAQVSVQKIPTDGFTDTASMMAFGYDPYLSSWSPYHGAAYAVVDACAKVVAAGGSYSSMRFSYQEYFERMTSEPHSWGLPASALLGALKMQLDLGLPSIGGKDSMSGTFENISVPPTLVAFGITPVKASAVISPEFKKAGSRLYLVRHTPLSNHMPDTEQLKKNWSFVSTLIAQGKVLSAWSVGIGGVAEGLFKMGAGNGIGVQLDEGAPELFRKNYGSVILETTDKIDFGCAVPIGWTIAENEIKSSRETVSGKEMLEAWTSKYDKVYPASTALTGEAETPARPSKAAKAKAAPFYKGKLDADGKPLVYIPVFPGTNCDYDTAKAFRAAGAKTRFGVFRNLSAEDVDASINEMAAAIDNCQILAFAGGFSAGDEPDGSGKFISSVIANAKVSASIERLLERGGLILGICNGFQALVKSGLLPYGHSGMLTADSPTLFRNDINRHISQIVTTRVCPNSSPWLAGMQEGELHKVAVSHGEGKFTVCEQVARTLFENSQVAFRYADPETGAPTMSSPSNPNGSSYAIEGITDPSGQILGKMGHSERYEEGLMKNIDGDRVQSIFSNAVNYFRK